MAIGQTAEEIARLAATHRFAMIGISCGSAKMVEPLSILVENLKTGGGSTSPIVIGGKITSSVSNIEALTGADHATSNIRKAVELCGIGTRTEALPI
jgi:methylmalonyl-CoA mutase cobalamin-binding subunit